MKCDGRLNFSKATMYNFYQSQLRYELTKDVYRKPTFEVELLGEKHF